jgi:hypothetical protein
MLQLLTERSKNALFVSINVEMIMCHCHALILSAKDVLAIGGSITQPVHIVELLSYMC